MVLEMHLARWKNSNKTRTNVLSSCLLPPPPFGNVSFGGGGGGKKKKKPQPKKRFAHEADSRGKSQMLPGPTPRIHPAGQYGRGGRRKASCQR